MSGAPLVSVIMPAFNSRRFIADSIRSVLDQNYPSMELIVIDDGSSDGTLEEIESFGSSVRLLRQPNRGPAAARNHGLSIARGELIAFLDSDDLWLPGKLSAQVAYLDDHRDVGIVFGDFLLWYPNPDGAFPQPPVPNLGNGQPRVVTEHSGWIYTQLLLDSVVFVGTALVRGSVFDQVGGFDEDLRTGEDYDLWLRVSRKFRADMLNRTLAYYRIRADSITRTPRPENNGYRVVLRALERFGRRSEDGQEVSAEVINNRLGQLCFDHGCTHYWKGDSCVAAQSFKLAAKHVPWRPKTWVYRFLSAMTCRYGMPRIRSGA